MHVVLDNEIKWCRSIIDARFEQYFSSEEDVRKHTRVELILPPELDGDSPYSKVVKENALNFDERFILVLSILPHFCPQALDSFFLNNKMLGRPYTEFGGWHGKSHSGFLPTCETALFLLAGDDLKRRLEIMKLFENDGMLFSKRIVQLEYGEPGEPKNSAALRISPEFLEYFTTGVQNKPDYSLHFPAKRITSRLEWENLVLSDITMLEIKQLITWIQHSNDILDVFGLRKNLKNGYRVLFYGPPGTGKTLTATLIGKKVGMDVYRVDLSQVVSKYIGETEKNLSNIFDQAENRNWILFFDEADSLFGTRTQASNSNDRAANQEISYLLQRVEDFPGIVILATNLKSNIDEAFLRRFQNTIYFPMPDVPERFVLWKNIFEHADVENRDDVFSELSEKYELAGGSLVNVARYAAISALMSERKKIMRKDIISGLAKELQKMGKVL